MEQQNPEQGATGDAPEAPNHSSDEQQAPEADVAELSARVQELEERAQRYLANWQRAQADLSNFRRQVERDQEEMAQWASAALMQQTLSVLDDLERAFGNVPSSLLSFTWIEGVWFVYKKLEAMLVARGLEAMVVEPGQHFDPNLHEAISEVDGVAGTVAEIVQRGYTVGGRLLRPALVTVGNGSVAAPEAEVVDGADDAEVASDTPPSEASEPPEDSAP